MARPPTASDWHQSVCYEELFNWLDLTHLSIIAKYACLESENFQTVNMLQAS